MVISPTELRKKIDMAPLNAIFVRLVFAFHAIIAVYRVVVAWQNLWFWLMLLSLIPLTIEMLVTLYLRKGKEWVRFSPAILFYLLAAIPPIWLLEANLYRMRTAQEINNTTCFISQVSLRDHFQTKFGLCLDLSGWAIAMEQALLFIVILGKWLMPKGNITKSQLSQILLVYLGAGADIMELFEIFEENKVITPGLIFTTLTLWSLALLQFSFTISTRSNSIKQSNSEELDEDKKSNAAESRSCLRINSLNLEILGIISTIVMQDGPFLIYRLFLLIGLKILSQAMIFFTFKNLLMISLQVYRLIVIYKEEKNQVEYDEGRQFHLQSMDTSTVVSELHG